MLKMKITPLKKEGDVLRDLVINEISRYDESISS